MKKFFKSFITFLLIFILTLTSYTPVFASTPKVEVYTDSAVIGQFYYENKIIYIRKMTVNRIPVFCMDIDLEYPHGETFKIYEKEDDSIINNILSLSYPNNDLAPLGITDPDDSYFITQTLLWCYLNQYDINKVYCDNDVLERALNTIYRNSQISTTSYTGDYYIFKSSNNKIQSIIFSLPLRTSMVKGISDFKEDMNSNDDMDIRDIIDNNNDNNNIFLGK